MWLPVFVVVVVLLLLILGAAHQVTRNELADVRVRLEDLPADARGRLAVLEGLVATLQLRDGRRTERGHQAAVVLDAAGRAFLEAGESLLCAASNVGAHPDRPMSAPAEDFGRDKPAGLGPSTSLYDRVPPRGK